MCPPMGVCIIHTHKILLEVIKSSLCLFLEYFILNCGQLLIHHQVVTLIFTSCLLHQGCCHTVPLSVETNGFLVPAAALIHLELESVSSLSLRQNPKLWPPACPLVRGKLNDRTVTWKIFKIIIVTNLSFCHYLSLMVTLNKSL